MARWMAAAVAAVILMMGSNAHALTWTWNYIDGSKADGQNLTTNSGLMDQAQYKGESIALYDGATLSGGAPVAGSTFIGYAFLRIGTMTLGGVDLAPPVDGTFTYGLDHQITAAIFYTGHHVDAQNFLFDTTNLKVFFDAGATCVIPGCSAPTAGLTVADFASLGTFTDGVDVETGLGNGAGVTGATVADGASDLFFALTDVLSTLNTCGAEGTSACGPFELTTAQHVLAFTDNNNQLCAGALCNSSFAAILAAGNTLYGNAFAPGATDLSTHSQNDGSVTKESAVPLPASLLLLGAGLVATSLARRRSRTARV